jgi:hypothetical protein
MHRETFYKENNSALAEEVIQKQVASTLPRDEYESQNDSLYYKDQS